MSKIMLNRPVSKKGAYTLNPISKGDKIPIISDTMFLAMINNEKKKKYSAYLISQLLELNYEEVYNTITFQKEKLDKDNYYDKGKTVDFICKINGEIIGIEMNNNNKVRTQLERNIGYATDLYQSNLSVGEIYHYNKVIQININNFTFEGNDKVIEKYAFTNEKGEYLTDKIQLIHIYLPNIRKKEYNKLKDWEKLLLVFNENKIESLKIAKGDKIMEEYVKDAVDTSDEEEIIGLYDKELHLEKLRLSELEEERVEAREQGEKSKQIEIARNMINKGMDKEIIKELTGLSTEELNNIS